MHGKDPLLEFSIHQWMSTPRMEIEDAYKWLFHATLGGEHAIHDGDAGPTQWLDREWRTLTQPKPSEPECVWLNPEHSLMRVNLRVYRERGGDKAMLLALFVASAQQFRADKHEFAREWKELGSRLHQHPINRLNWSNWQRLDRDTRKLGFPAIDHSTNYEKTYMPAYRVILGSLW